MIKMSELFISKRRIVLIIGLVCVIVLGSVTLTNGVTKKPSEKNPTTNNGSALVNNPTLKLMANPEKYTPDMSSTPGIKIDAVYPGIVSKVRYSTTSGTFVTWNEVGVGVGEVTQLKQNVEREYGNPIYWSPLNNGNIEETGNITIKVEILGKDNKILQEKQLNIKGSKDKMYIVEDSQDVFIGNYQRLKLENIPNN